MATMNGVGSVNQKEFDRADVREVIDHLNEEEIALIRQLAGPADLDVETLKVVKKLFASVNRCWDGLDYQREKLATNLKLLGDEMPRDLRAKYTKTLKDLTKACNLIANIECVGPHMTFEMGLLKGEVTPDKKHPRPRR